MTQLLADVARLEHCLASNDARAPREIEFLACRLSSFRRPEPYAPEWRALHKCVSILLRRAARSEAGRPHIGDRDALRRLTAFVDDNPDLAAPELIHESRRP